MKTVETVVTTNDADVKTGETEATTLSKDCCEAVGRISAIKQKETKPKDDVAEDQVDPPTQVVEVFLHTISREELKLKQEQCPELGPIISFVRNSDLHMDAKQARFLSSKSSRYYLDNDILYHIPYDSRSIHKDILLGKQLCVPISLRADLLESKHKLAGHAGGRRLYLSLLTSFYWQSMFTDAKAYATSCTVCQQNKMSTQTHKVPLKSIKNEHLFNVWSMDVLKMPQSHQGNSLALVCVENFSLWPEITPLANETAPEIANALVNTIFVRHGIPQQLLSDRGSNFTSKLLNKVCQLLKVKRLLTATYRPQSDPAEAQNKMILQTLRCMAENEDANWEDNLPAVLLAHRSTPSPTRADMSPYKLLYARDMPTPDEVQFENLRDTQMSTASKEFLSNLVEKLQLAHKLAKAQIKQTQEENKKFYDRDAKAVIYPPGTKVWLRREKVDQGRSPKLFKRYNGPFFITTKIGENTYQLRECNTNQLLKAPVNADRLKLVIDRTDKLSYSKRAAVQESDDEDILTDDPADKEVTQTDTNPRTVLTKVDRQLQCLPTLLTDSSKDKVTTDVTDLSTDNATTDVTDVKQMIDLLHKVQELVKTKNEDKNVQVERTNTRYDLRRAPKHNAQRKHIEKLLKLTKTADSSSFLVKWEDGTEGWVPLKDIPEQLVREYFVARDEKKLHFLRKAQKAVTRGIKAR